MLQWLSSDSGSRLIGLGPLGVRIKGTLGHVDPLNKVPVQRARSRVEKAKGPFNESL